MTAADWSKRRAQLDDAIGFVVRYWQPFAILALLAVLGTCWHQHNLDEQAKGALQERLKIVNAELERKVPLVKVYEGKIVHDTVRVAHAIVRVDSMRDTVLAHLTDTVIVREYVARTDSLVQACSEITHDCQAFRANATAVIAAQDTKIKALESYHKPKPCGFAWALGAGVVRERTAFEVGPALTVGIGCRF